MKKTKGERKKEKKYRLLFYIHYTSNSE